MEEEEGRSPLRRAFWLAVLLGIGIVGAGLLNFGVPYGLLKAGIGSGYEIGFLRWGTAEYHRRFGSEARALRDVVGWAWGRGGEELRIGYDVTTAEVAIELPETDLYQIRFVRRAFHGKAKVTWGF